MKIRIGAFVASVAVAIAMIAATSGVAALEQRAPVVKDTPVAAISTPAVLPELSRQGVSERGAVLGGNPEPTATPVPTAVPTPPPPTPAPPTMVGIASNYPGTAGWIGQATVALPGDLGGRYNGQVNGFVTVCADRCARLPVVDWCQCYWGTSDQRIVDLSHPAWALVSDRPLAEGLTEVQLYLER